jgi:CRP-like cAMP-binding protein
MKSDYPLPLIDALQQVAPFHLLDADTLGAMIAGRRVLRAARGEILTHRDTPAEGMHVVLDGQVKRFLLSSSGSERIVMLAGPGECFGEEAALLGRPYLVSTQATRASMLLLVRTPQLQAAMSRCAPFAEAITMRLAAANYELLSTLQLYLQCSSTQRVAHYLAQLAPDDAERCEIRLASDKQTIAAQLNLTPETLSRVLSRFVRAGMIRPQGRRGLVLNKLSMLRDCAGD